VKFQIITDIPGETQTACLIVGVYDERQLTPAAEYLDKLSDGFIRKILAKGDLNGKIQQTLLLHHVPNVNADRVLLVGCGKQDALTGSRFRDIVQQATKTISNTNTGEATYYLTELPLEEHDQAWQIQQAIETITETVYQFKQFKSKSNDKQTLLEINLAISKQTDKEHASLALKRGQAIAQGIKLTKDLANSPANVCTPTYLAEQAQLLDNEFKTITTRVLEEADMEKLGMGALLSVSKGSKQPAKLIVMEYHGDQAKNTKPHVLIGKGITFDSGGLSLKPPAAMDEMKFDMCGAASVLGTLQTIAQLELPLYVIGIAACSENLPGGQATKPGDIVTSMSGQTIEILNTDAEGRLVLCDALTYAKKYDPETVIDIATLTGAMLVALGYHTIGMMSNDETLAKALLNAGKQSNDPIWQLPLGEKYQKSLSSNFADMANIGNDRSAGSIVAGCFLSRFAEDYPWAHLDIVGAAWKRGKEKGATGRPVAALTQYLINAC